MPALDELAGAAAALLVPGPDLGVPGLALRLGHVLGRLGVQQQDHVLHGCLQVSPVSFRRAPSRASRHLFHERGAADSDNAREKFQAFRPLAVSLDSRVRMAS